MKGELLADDVTEPDDIRTRAEIRRYNHAKASAERKDSFFYVYRAVAGDISLGAMPIFGFLAIGLWWAALWAAGVWAVAVFIGTVVRMLNAQQERMAYLGALVEAHQWELHMRDVARKNSEKRRA